MWAHIKLSLAFCSEPNPYSLRDFQPSTISGSWFFPSLRNGGQLWQGARSISAVWSLRGAAKLDEAKGMLEFRTAMAISSFGSIVTDYSNLQNLENQMANEQSEVSLDTSIEADLPRCPRTLRTRTVSPRLCTSRLVDKLLWIK